MPVGFDRKYRPWRFDELVGQDEAVKLVRERVAGDHNATILLVGPPGTGKTTLARIYANARKLWSNGKGLSSPRHEGSWTLTRFGNSMLA